jgi:acyl carrier protein
MERQQQIRAYILENFLLGQDGGFGDEESLLGAGIVDSTGVLEIVGFLEKTFSIELQDEDMVPENLDSIRNLASFVDRKLATQRMTQ